MSPFPVKYGMRNLEWTRVRDFKLAEENVSYPESFIFIFRFGNQIHCDITNMYRIDIVFKYFYLD